MGTDALCQCESFQFLLSGGSGYCAVGQRQQARAGEQTGESLYESSFLAGSCACGALLSESAPLLRSSTETTSGTRATDDLLQHHRPQTGPGRIPCTKGVD